jgi:hypothetical protein
LQLILGQLRSLVLSILLIGGYPTFVLTLGGNSSPRQEKVPPLPGFVTTERAVAEQYSWPLGRFSGPSPSGPHDKTRVQGKGLHGAV